MEENIRIWTRISENVDDCRRRVPMRRESSVHRECTAQCADFRLQSPNARLGDCKLSFKLQTIFKDTRTNSTVSSVNEKLMR